MKISMRNSKNGTQFIKTQKPLMMTVLKELRKFKIRKLWPQVKISKKAKFLTRKDLILTRMSIDSNFNYITLTSFNIL